MTIIAVYNSSGCVGRCDAHCHEALEPHCVCICGGKYHGAGSSQAAQKALTEDWKPMLEAWAKSVGVDLDACTVKTDVQGSLFH